ncbi:MULTISPECIES: co-chaperone DjlA [Oceanimonas]|uniref:Co-chaperone protein DjlA n=1 Tax=Oceanimonas doudoroffii TaxID=84158 RepID=A0A233RBH4_9GAMM|nr:MULTISPECIES: co-chaperone DjlA [Oceanimonas]NHH99521.1 Co-chaperone protein DjlA [Oceanimonas sp. MB9]OXY80739.1 molecular chaperone DjlA [Oceanimonas doudoroffii]
MLAHIKGKIIGCLLGFLIGNIPGALLGLWLGHKVDQKLAGAWGMVKDTQQQFLYATFATMGHLAKSSGRVTSEEIRLAEQLMAQMRLGAAQQAEARQAFRDGKESDFPLQQTLRRFRAQVRNSHNLLRFFMEVQLQLVFADGELHPAERRLLHTIAAELGFSEQELEQLLAFAEAQLHMYRQGRAGGQGGFTTPPQDRLRDAYRILEVESGADDATVKRAYRRQMSKHHPDKLVAQGLPKEMMEMAKEKAQDIQQAWETIKAARNLR